MAVFDPSSLLRLVDDPARVAFAHEFARSYQCLLGGRVRRVVAAVAGGDVDDAMDAVLSLKVSSSMTGLHDLAGLASQVERCLRNGDRLGAHRCCSALPVSAQRADAALSHYLSTTA